MGEVQWLHGNRFLAHRRITRSFDRLLEQAQKVNVTDEQLKEQRVSFAFGNAPESSRITKESVRAASRGIRITGR